MLEGVRREAPTHKLQIDFKARFPNHNVVNGDRLLGIGGWGLELDWTSLVESWGSPGATIPLGTIKGAA